MQEMTPEPGPSQEVVFSRQTAVRLGRAIRNVATSEVGTRAAALGGLLLAFLFAINALNVVNSYVCRYFMTALERRDSHEFVRQALFYVGVFAASTIAAVLYRFTEERLGLLWREWLTRRLVGMYLAGQVFYRVEVTGTLGNADQRIADDVRSFTRSTLSLFLIFLNGAITMLAFSGVLWSISRLLFAVAVGYAALGSLCAVVLGRPLVRLNYDQADREANFRNELVHVRQNAEAVVLLHREAHFSARLYQHVGAFTGNLKRIIAVNRNLGFFTTGYNYLIQIIPVLIVGPLFIRGTVEFGVIPQASMAFVHVLGAFSLVVTQFPSLSSYAAVLARLSALAESTETIAARGAGGIAVAEEDEPRLAIEGLTLRTPRTGASSSAICRSKCGPARGCSSPHQTTSSWRRSSGRSSGSGTAATGALCGPAWTMCSSYRTAPTCRPERCANWSSASTPRARCQTTASGRRCASSASTAPCAASSASTASVTGATSYPPRSSSWLGLLVCSWRRRVSPSSAPLLRVSVSSGRRTSSLHWPSAVSATSSWVTASSGARSSTRLSTSAPTARGHTPLRRRSPGDSNQTRPAPHGRRAAGHHYRPPVGPPSSALSPREGSD